jgi:hypothetical protein
MAPDNLSHQHYKTVRNEIEGRFFSAEEANLLKSAISAHTIVDPALRATAAKCWEQPEETKP